MKINRIFWQKFAPPPLEKSGSDGYILLQKAGSSRNNICIGLSFELIVRRVAASNTPAFFFYYFSSRDFLYFPANFAFHSLPVKYFAKNIPPGVEIFPPADYL